MSEHDPNNYRNKDDFAYWMAHYADALQRIATVCAVDAEAGGYPEWLDDVMSDNRRDWRLIAVHMTDDEIRERFASRVEAARAEWEKEGAE